MTTERRANRRDDTGRVRGVTVVAYYDAPPADLADLVARVQGWLGQELAGFRPRSLRQVHATLIALDPGADLAGVLGHLRGLLRRAAADPVRRVR